MYTINKVSSDEALKLINYCFEQVKKDNKSVAVSVCGPECELIAFVRMDGTSPAASKIAQNKAYTAASDRSDTSKMGERMRGNDNPAFWGDERITGFGGGVPIVQKDKVIGAIGVSGLPEADDEQLAKEAVKSVFG
ncbi:MAG TPA: heme-binding protein [Cyclobacteriaceae bacterium]|jgi:glc operon protein GlcG|nr:heme-binding protein [Cyclobacteriaceae bacterium]